MKTPGASGVSPIDKEIRVSKAGHASPAELGLFKNGVSVELIAKSLKLNEEKVRQIIENQFDK